MARAPGGRRRGGAGVQFVEPVRRHLAATPRAVIHDLGAGTGSMGRWLAAQLPGPQHWVMYDSDPDLLKRARANMIDTAGDGAPVTVETHQRDVAGLRAGDLDSASLIAASALLDMLTAEEVKRVVAACVDADCPTLLTISVIGRVELAPSDPEDATIAEAFNAHQRRTTGGRRLLGPDAVHATIEAFGRRGVSVRVRRIPLAAWRGPDRADVRVVHGLAGRGVRATAAAGHPDGGVRAPSSGGRSRGTPQRRGPAHRPPCRLRLNRWAPRHLFGKEVLAEEARQQ